MEAFQMTGHFRLCTFAMPMFYSLVLVAKNVKHKVIWGYGVVQGYNFS